MYCRETADRCPPIGEVWAVEPDMPVWLDDLRDHCVFRDELGMCLVGAHPSNSQFAGSHWCADNW